MHSKTSDLPFSYRLLPLVLCALLVTPCSLSYAQSDDDPQLESGTWALQFQITDNFTLGAFEGSVLSAKRQLSESRALRLGLDINAVTSSQDERSFAAGGSEDSQTDLNLDLDLQYVSYLNQEGLVRAYAGVGPTLGYGRTKIEETSDEQGSELTRNTYLVGVVGLVGAEWFVRSNISLTAEYGALASYAAISTQRVNVQNGNVVGESDESRWRFGSRPVRFGVSVYF